MNIFYTIIGILKAILLKIFPSFGYKGVVDTQICIYNKLKKKIPGISENELLNRLIISRIKAPPRVASRKEEYAHYEPLLNNPNKALKDVIWKIVFYEYFESRTDKCLMKKVPPESIVDALSEAKEYIKERVNKIENERKK